MTSRARAGLAVERVSARADFLALEGEWNGLAAASPNPLLRHEWFAACLETYAARDEIALFLVRENGRLRAAAPLVVERSGGVPRLRMLGWQTMEPEALLHDDPAALERLCVAVLTAGKPLRLSRLDAASPELQMLRALSRGRGVGLVRESCTRTHATLLAEDAAAVEASMSGKKRSELRRLKTQLAKHGPVTFDVLEAGEADVDSALAELMRVEAASWKARSATALAADAGQREFLRRYALAAAAAGMLRVSSLRVGGQAIAVQMDIEHGGRLWGLKMGADEAWSKYAPGILSTHELICWAADRGLHCCEHLGAAEAWQTRWPFELREQSGFRFYPARPGAVAALALDVLEVARRRMRDRSVRRLADRWSGAGAAPPRQPAPHTEAAAAPTPESRPVQEPAL